MASQVSKCPDDVAEGVSNLSVSDSNPNDSSDATEVSQGPQNNELSSLHVASIELVRSPHTSSAVLPAFLTPPLRPL